MNSTESLLSTKWGPATLTIIEIGLVATMLALSTRTALLRDTSSGITDPQQRMYSMAKTQLAFWSAIILGLFVWVYFDTTRFSDLLNGTTLILLGISAGTAVVAKAVGDLPAPPPAPKTPTDPDPAPPPPKQTHVSFLTDILSDAEGMNIHRLQMLLWTGVFGVVLIAETISHKEFPTFDDKIYGLMGISSGTYVWFKRTEK